MTDQIKNVLTVLDTEGGTEIEWERLLSETLRAFDCTTGSIHILDPATENLNIKASHGIPDFLLPKMNVIPIGKGMAGVAAQRQEPVQMCNLQTDDSGIARPSAKETKVEGAIAAPMIYNGKLYGTLGVAKSVPYDFTDQETDELMKIGERIASKLAAERN